MAQSELSISLSEKKLLNSPITLRLMYDGTMSLIRKQSYATNLEVEFDNAYCTIHTVSHAKDELFTLTLLWSNIFVVYCTCIIYPAPNVTGLRALFFIIWIKLERTCLLLKRSEEKKSRSISVKNAADATVIRTNKLHFGHDVFSLMSKVQSTNHFFCHVEISH